LPCSAIPWVSSYIYFSKSKHASLFDRLEKRFTKYAGKSIVILSIFLIHAKERDRKRGEKQKNLLRYMQLSILEEKLCHAKKKVFVFQSIKKN